MRWIRAGWVCPVSGPPLEDAAVGVEDGRIVEVRQGRLPGGADASFPGCVLLPGFVNAHTHLELTVMRGFLEDLPFPEWLRTLTRTKYEALSREDLTISARLGAMECLRGGVTAVGEMTDVGTGWDAMCELGMHGVAYQEVFGPADAQADAAMASLEANVARARQTEAGARRVGVSPHAPYTVSSALYERARDFCDANNLPMAVHVAESDDEVRFVRDGDGPFAEGWKRRDIPVTARSTTPLGYLDRLGILGPATLAVHAIHAGPDDVERMAEAGVSVAHCPKSNLKLGHAIAPVLDFLAAGIPAGLGSDSVASNNAVDMFEEMRLAVYLQRSRAGDPEAMNARAALEMATLGGARCLGLQDDLGTLEPGKLADFVVVEMDDPALTPSYDPVDTLVYSASRKNVSATYLAGERVALDAGPTIDEARSIARRLAAP